MCFKADHAVRTAFSKLTDSAMLHTTAAWYLRWFKPTATTEDFHLKRAAELSPALDVEFAVFQRRRQLDELADAKSKMNAIVRLRIDKAVHDSKTFAQRANASMHTLWKQLRTKRLPAVVARAALTSIATQIAAVSSFVLANKMHLHKANAHELPSYDPHIDQSAGSLLTHASRICNCAAGGGGTSPAAGTKTTISRCTSGLCCLFAIGITMSKYVVTAVG